ncbi:MAG: hypothetical protein AAF843_17040 [Bacteroidota bacterium]
MYYLLSFSFLFISVGNVYASFNQTIIKDDQIRQFSKKNTLLLRVLGLLSLGAGAWSLTQAEGFLAGIFCSIVLWITLASCALLFIPLITPKN